MIGAHLTMILLLFIMFFQDLLHRRVHTLGMVGLTLLSLILSMRALARPDWVGLILSNAGVLISLLVLSILTQILMRREAGIGLGDIWMLLICVPAMSQGLFLPFLLASFALGLILYLLMRSSGRGWESIPLAGIVSLLLALLIGSDLLLDFDRYTLTPVFGSLTGISYHGTAV